MAEPTFDADALTQTVEGEGSPVDLDDTSSETEDSGVDWGGLSDAFESDDDALPPEPSPPPPVEAPPAEPQSPLPAAAETPVVEETPPTPVPPPEVPPAVEPVAEVPPPQVEAPTPEPVAPVVPEVTTEQMQNLRNGYVDSIASNYTLSEEDASSLLTNPNGVLPQLAANLHANVMEEASRMVTQILQQTLPGFVDNVITGRETRAAGEDAFFSMWPELAEHKERVTQLASTYRQLNPQATRDQFSRDVGIQAWMAVGLEAGALATKLNPPAQAAPAAAPVQPTPAPANPGGTQFTPPAQNRNPFDLMTTEFEEDWI